MTFTVTPVPRVTALLDVLPTKISTGTPAVIVMLIVEPPPTLKVRKS
jgi:hypothetical protein